jgi:S-formylglutathione hydrolase
MKQTRREAISTAAFAGLLAVPVTGMAQAANTSISSREVKAQLTSSLVPSPVNYTAMLPAGYDTAQELPLLLALHGGDGIAGFSFFQGTVEAAWSSGELAPCVVVSVNSGRSFWLDWKDGSQRWETFLMQELLPHLRSTFKVSKEARKLTLIGHSMGGLGGLRLAFKYPEQFAGVAALESAIEPTFDYGAINVRNNFFRPLALMESYFGKPIDKAFWASNNPANIAVANAARIKASGLQIYLDVGDRDILNTFDGVEFLHRVLWDHGIDHEYRLVRGGDHWGRTVPPRFRDGMRFLTRQIFTPEGEDPSQVANRERINQMKKAANVDPAALRLPLPRTTP